MSRRQAVRKIHSLPESPIKLRLLEDSPGECVPITYDELEAVRLADIDGLYQDEAASIMDVSRATFARILFSARGKIAKALFGGLGLSPKMGNVEYENKKIKCPIHKEKKRKGRLCLCPGHKGENNG